MRLPVLILPALLVGCAGSSSHSVDSVAQPIIEGSAAPELSSVVQVTHTTQGTLCSGVLIAPNLVATALHCVFATSSSGDAPLPISGFRIGFGSDVQFLTFRTAASMEWIGEPALVSIQTAASKGEDVAILHLAESAPAGFPPVQVASTYQPSTADLITIAGFGISSLTTGSTGVRLEAVTMVTGFDPPTGILQVQGRSACFGDSGGPMLLAPETALVGVIGDVAGSSDASFCDLGLTFGATVANPALAGFLGAACVAAGGCGPVTQMATDAGGGNLDAGLRSDAALWSDAAEAGASHDAASAIDGPRGRLLPPTHDGGGCSIRPLPTQEGIGPWILLAFSGAVGRRSRCRASEVRQHRRVQGN